MKLSVGREWRGFAPDTDKGWLQQIASPLCVLYPGWGYQVRVGALKFFWVLWF